MVKRLAIPYFRVFKNKNLFSAKEFVVSMSVKYTNASSWSLEFISYSSALCYVIYFNNLSDDI